MPTRTRDDRRWLAILALAFVAGLALSWQRWADPVIDSGREMNQPLRLLQGERLYADVGHIYAPLSPYLHAAAYRVFGPSLTVLYADGIFSAAIILVLVYQLARRILDSREAGVATLLVMWLCAFKPSGNYVFPYAFSAVHGTLLALVALALCARAMVAPTLSRFAWSGVAGGAALLAKTEMGLAAVSGGLAAAWLSRQADTAAAGRRALAFAAAAALTAGVVYAAIAANVGWRTLAFDNWLLPFNLPAPLAHFNATLSGFDRPLASFARVALAALKLGLLAAMIGAGSYLVAGPPATARRARLVLAGAIAVLLALSVTTGLDWDRGPFLAMPVLLAVMLMCVARTAASDEARLVMLYCAFALVHLARTFLHVRSGGAYGSFLLPISIVVFTYASTRTFARLLPDPAPRRVARATVLSLLLVSAVGTAVVLGYRYRRVDTVAVTTARGTLIAPADTGTAWNEALAFINASTRPDEYVAVLPEGTSLVFLSGRRNPLREEIVTPGFLDAAGEERAIQALERTGTGLVLIVNRATREFGAEAFGRDYCRRLMQWIDAHYRACATFGAQDPRLSIGDTPFFVRAYCR